MEIFLKLNQGFRGSIARRSAMVIACHEYPIHSLVEAIVLQHYIDF